MKKDDDMRGIENKNPEDKSPTKENGTFHGKPPGEGNPGFNPQQGRGNYMHTNQFHPPYGMGHHHHHHHPHNFTGERYTPLPPSEVTCYKCGEKGAGKKKHTKILFF